MKKKLIHYGVSFAVLCSLLLVFGGCPIIDSFISDSDTVIVASPALQNSALHSVPVAASDNPAQPAVLDYFRFEDRHWYIIDAGYIRNAFIAQLGQAHYDGRTPVTLTVSEATERGVSASLTSTVSNSIVFSDSEQVTRGISEEVTRAVTAGITVGNTMGAEVDVWLVKGSVERSIETSLETTHGVSIRENEEILRGFSLSHGRTTETSMTSIESFSRTQAQQVSYDIGRNNELQGWYRYAMYGVSDVFFIISTSMDNERWLSWDIISAVRPEYTPHFEYSPTGKFENAPIDNLITFSDGFYKDLPKPDGYRVITDVNIAASGFVQRNPNRQTYKDGDLVEIFAIPNPGYKFVNWTGTGAPTGMEADNARILINTNSDLTLTANFQIMHTIATNVNVEGRGSISRNLYQDGYAPGTQITITAVANTGFRFENWEGVPAGVDPKNASIVFTVSDSLELTANFRSVNPRVAEEIFNYTGQQHDWPMPIDITYPATIEVFILGAGGGGQGGFYSWKPFATNRRGTGGAGGGGAATYMKFETNNRITFNVTVGKGGIGGEPKDSDISSWSAGHPGKPGENSSVSWGANILTARGGSGGGGGGDRDLSGGNGGAENTEWPAGNINPHSTPGGRGTEGTSSGDKESVGGNAGVISTDMYFGGGGGAFRPGGEWARPVNGGTGGGGSSAYGGVGSNNHGGTGGNGRVHIIVKWDE